MADLHVDFLGKRLAGPVIAASGTFGFGPEYAGIEDFCACWAASPARG